MRAVLVGIWIEVQMEGSKRGELPSALANLSEQLPIIFCIGGIDQEDLVDDRNRFLLFPVLQE